MVAILRWCRGWICLLYPILNSNSTILYTSTIISIKPYNIITTPNSNGSNTKSRVQYRYIYFLNWDVVVLQLCIKTRNKEDGK